MKSQNQINSRNTSIKTRIETISSHKRIITAIQIPETLPLKQGLKQKGRIVKLGGPVIPETLPLKQGLKQFYHGSKIKGLEFQKHFH